MQLHENVQLQSKNELKSGIIYFQIIILPLIKISFRRFLISLLLHSLINEQQTFRHDCFSQKKRVKCEKLPVTYQHWVSSVRFYSVKDGDFPVQHNRKPHFLSFFDWVHLAEKPWEGMSCHVRHSNQVNICPTYCCVCVKEETCHTLL